MLKLSVVLATMLCSRRARFNEKLLTPFLFRVNTDITLLNDIKMYKSLILLMALLANASADKHYGRVRGVMHQEALSVGAQRRAARGTHVMHAAERTARKPRHLYKYMNNKE